MSMLIILVLLVVAGLYAVGLYNGLVGGRNNYKNAFAQIDVQLTRRYDLIPNLVETVKGYASHESEVFEKATNARAEAMSAHSVADTSKAESQLTGALTDLRAVAENYPTLRATETASSDS